ncbi:universal stress protein [Alcanivorax sp. 1008]|uniref:universal stress protein n=1 Tax=Alcanivorax sp. 1008 TaxID=2816853 RepID=UPI001D3B75DE|nr:universal stress protein [Alcanivorax sp. 1008]MCC1497751.1 universal stress protein [Alcanivorax sp. 1008]
MKSVIVLLDSDINAPQPALNKAVFLAKKLGAPLQVYVNAYSAALIRAVGMDKQHLQRARDNVMQGWEKQLRRILEKLDAPDSETHIFWEQSESVTLAEFIRRMDPALLVLHRAQEPILKRLLLTPRDWKVIRKAPCPVLCVGETPWPSQPAVVAAVDPDHGLDHPDTLNGDIVAAARQMASNLDTEVQLAHVVEYPDETLIMLAGEAVPVSLSSIDSLRQHYQERLHSCAEEFSLPAESALMLEGTPHRALGEYMDQHPGILVLGSVHRGAIRRLLLGSTAEQILLHSCADILVVKPENFSSPWLSS